MHNSVYKSYSWSLLPEPKQACCSRSKTCGPGRICCFIHKQWLLFLLPSPQLMFCCPSWSLMCFAVSSIFLFECVLIFFILKSLPTKGASPFNSCWETSAQWIQTARQCRRPDETSFGQASTTCPWPLQLGCLEHIMDDAGFWNGSLVLWMWKHAVCFHTWKLFKERSEIFAFMRIHWTFFDWLQTNFFFTTYGDCFQCVIIETRDIYIPSLGKTWQIFDLSWFVISSSGLLQPQCLPLYLYWLQTDILRDNSVFPFI